MDQRYLTRIALKTYQGLVSSTTTIWQCLPFSSTTLRGKQCQHPIAVMGVVDNANTSQLVSLSVHIVGTSGTMWFMKQTNRCYF